MRANREVAVAKAAALSLYFAFRFCCIHKSLRVTPAMAAGGSDMVRDMEWMLGLIDVREGKAKRGPYKKHA